MTRHRRGTSILEVVVATVILTATTTVCLQLLAVGSAQRRAIEDRQAAIQAAANVMERLSARPFDALSGETVADVQLPDALKQRLPTAELAVEVINESAGDEVESKRIAVSLRWDDRHGQPVRPVRLVAWKVRGGGQP